MSFDPGTNPPIVPGYSSPQVVMAQPRTSTAAIASLILGIAGCVPFLTSILATIFGIVGIRARLGPVNCGHGMAVAGLILGLLGIIGWGISSVGVVAFFQAAKPVTTVARQFTKDLASGDVQSAAKFADTTLNTEDLQKISDEMKPWGTLNDVTILTRNVTSINGVTSWHLTGTAYFANATKSVDYDVTSQTHFVHQVSAVHFH